MRSLNSLSLLSRSGRLVLPVLFVFLSLALPGRAQTAPAENYFARVNSFGLLAAYSNDSSPMILGITDRRKLLEFGASYSRRLFLNHRFNWQYNAEFLPVALESDPLTRAVEHQILPTKQTFVTELTSPLITCTPQTVPYMFKSENGTIFSGTITYSCHGREWTIGQALSPVGFQWNFRPQHRVQPFLIGHAGTMFTTHPIPLSAAGSFNFTFDLGAGIEIYRTPTRSIRAEYRYHHISNDYTADQNPGIDNGVFQVTYAFGR